LTKKNIIAYHIFWVTVFCCEQVIGWNNVSR